jgi:cytochrome c553
MKHRFALQPLLLGPALLLGAFGLWSEASAAGGDAAAGAKSAMYCAYCHGVDGNSTHTGTPRLAGQSVESFVAKMKVYKSNQKVFHPMMAFLTGGLSDKDVQDLAAFYAQQPVRSSSVPYVGSNPYK